MTRVFGIFFAVIFLVFSAPSICHAGNDDISPEYPFNVETIDMEPDTRFTVNITARGSFVIDWGDPDSANNIQNITRNNVNKTTYSHTYTTGGVHTIRFGGLATKYSTAEVGAIDFDSNKNIRSIHGNISRIFPTLNDGTASGDQPRFYNLFHLSTGITGSIPPDLFADLHGAPVSMMFRGVFDMSSTTDIVLSGEIPPNLFGDVSGAPAPHMFRSTFYGCRGLTGEIPHDLFANISGAPAEYMFYNTFYNDEGLTGSIPSDLFAGITGVPQAYTFANVFTNCSGLTGSIPHDLFANISGAPAMYSFSSVFMGCAGLDGEIPADLFAGVSGTPADYMFYQTFMGCTGLTGKIPPTLFAGIDGVAATGMFTSVFNGCSGLTGYIPYELFAHIENVGLGTVIGFNGAFNYTGGLSKTCPAGMANIIKPDSSWKAAFCGGCLLGQYREGDVCKNCPAGYSFNGTVAQSINDCQMRCMGGSYIDVAGASKCADVGAGFWAPESTVKYGEISPRYACPDGLTTAGYGRGADDITDCGKLLHLGNDKTLYLRRDKGTTPALAVQLGGQTFYADMGIGAFGYLRTRYNNQTYAIYDDTDRYGDAQIPNEYVRIGYIESRDWAYIDTGFVPTLDMDFYYLAYMPVVYGDAKTAVYWVEQGNGMQYYASAFVEDPNHIRAYRKNMGGPQLYTTITDLGTRLIEWQTHGNTFTINGHTYTFPEPVSGDFGNYRLFVLGKNKTGKMDTSDSGFILDGVRLYRWRIERDGDAIQDMVPVRRVSDNAVGMYDMVTGQFFGNAGTQGYFVGE